MSAPRAEPTPEEIAEICAEIRKGWSAERWKRQDDRVEWEIPLMKHGPEFLNANGF